MSNNLKEYFYPLIVLCQFLGLWLIRFTKDVNIFDIICYFPIHILYWYSFYFYSCKVNVNDYFYVLQSPANILIDVILEYVSLFSNIILVAHNFLLRNRIKKMFINLSYLEEHKLYSSIKRRNLKLDLFIFILVMLIMICEDVIIVQKYVSNSTILYYCGNTLSFYLNFIYIFVICEILYITRNIFCKVNELLSVLNKGRLKMNFITTLSDIHFHLIYLSKEQNLLFAVPMLTYAAIVFLYSVSMTFYNVVTLKGVLMSEESSWLLNLTNSIWVFATNLLLFYACRFWMLIEKEVSNLIILSY